MECIYNWYLFCISTCILLWTYLTLFECYYYWFNNGILLYFIICVFIVMYLLYLLGFLCNLSVHVFIKLIYSKLIYFEGRACYIGKINQYMLQIACSFVLDLIVKAVIAAGAACSSLHI